MPDLVQIQFLKSDSLSRKINFLSILFSNLKVAVVIKNVDRKNILFFLKKQTLAFSLFKGENIAVM